MSPSKVKTSKAIKFIYINKERLWLKVDKFENNCYCVYIDSKPISKVLHTINMSEYTKTKWWKQTNQ